MATALALVSGDDVNLYSLGDGYSICWDGSRYVFRRDASQVIGGDVNLYSLGDGLSICWNGSRYVVQGPVGQVIGFTPALVDAMIRYINEHQIFSMIKAEIAAQSQAVASAQLQAPSPAVAVVSNTNPEITLDSHPNVLELSTRVLHCLRDDELDTIGKVVARTEAEMLRMPNFGRTSLFELRQELYHHGWTLRDSRFDPQLPKPGLSRNGWLNERRDKEILQALKDGSSTGAVAARYGLSYERIRQIQRWRGDGAHRS